MNALKKAKITQEVKDAMVGHQRAGAARALAPADGNLDKNYKRHWELTSILGTKARRSYGSIQ